MEPKTHILVNNGLPQTKKKPVNQSNHNQSKNLTLAFLSSIIQKDNEKHQEPHFNQIMYESNSESIQTPQNNSSKQRMHRSLYLFQKGNKKNQQYRNKINANFKTGNKGFLSNMLGDKWDKFINSPQIKKGQILGQNTPSQLIEDIDLSNTQNPYTQIKQKKFNSKVMKHQFYTFLKNYRSKDPQKQREEAENRLIKNRSCCSPQQAIRKHDFQILENNLPKPKTTRNRQNHKRQMSSGLVPRIHLADFKPINNFRWQKVQGKSYSVNQRI